MHWSEDNDEVSFRTSNTIFFDNIAGKYSETQKVALFNTGFNDGEYTISCSPGNEEDLKEICDVLAGYSDSYKNLAKNTQDFLEDGRMYDYFGTLLDDDVLAEKIVDDAIEYTKSLFEKS